MTEERRAADGSWAIATPHWLATDAGARAFESGGNALDAALAAATSLTVVLPDNCGLGGDLIALVRDPTGRSTVVNASGPAAERTSSDDLRRRHGAAMPVYGPDTVTVPGLLAGWEALWTHGARLPWADAFTVATAQARDGIPTARSVANALAEEARRIAADEGMRAVFYPDGQPLRPDAPLRQPRLAETLERVAADGARAFYAGELGRRWLAHMASRGSVLTGDDLASFEPEITSPLKATRGCQEILTAPPNSQGVLLLMILGALDAADPHLDPMSADAPRLAAAFDDAVRARQSYLADPRSSDSPSELVTRILGGDTPTAASAPTAPRAHRGDTVAIVAADAEGRAVSLIQSLYYAFGAGILDPATGIIAHNRGSHFSLDPGSPNVIAPGKRPAHTLMPVLAEERGALRAVLGTMGGSAQPQILTHLLLHLRRGASCDSALGAPRWLVMPGEAGVVAVEPAVPDEAVRALTAAGWARRVISASPPEAGQAQLIVAGRDGAYRAASDPRSQGAARTG